MNHIGYVSVQHGSMVSEFILFAHGLSHSGADPLPNMVSNKIQTR